MHSIKKQYLCLITVFVITALLALGLYLALHHDTIPIETTDAIRAEDFMVSLEPFLPAKLTSEMSYHGARQNTDGSVFFHWAKKIEPSSDELQCSLQVVMADTGLLSYHYKDYGYRENRIKPQNMTKQAASALVSAFSATYLEKGSALQFENKPAYWSLYDPEKVESWVAVNGGKEYLVMVDLMYGYIVYAGVVSSPDTYIIDTTLK